MWVFLALLTALFTSFKDVCGRKALEKVDFYVVAWAWPAASLPFLFGFLVFDGVPEIGQNFWMALVGSTIILTVAALCFFRAIQISSLSESIPMLAFSPMFLLVSSPLMIQEKPELLGVAGILLIVIGSYVLNFRQRDQGVLEPFFCLLKNKGSRLMLLVAVLYSIGANIDKIGVLNSSPVMWIFSINATVSFVLTGVLLWRVRKPVKVLGSAWKVLLLMGLFTSIALLCQMYALRMTLVPYVIAIKRTSVVMTVLFGLFVFKEKRLPERLIGVVLMVLGVFIISFFVSA